MGVYTQYDMYNSHPAYHMSSAGQWLYFVEGTGWLIGPFLGASSGFIFTARQSYCPYHIVDGWMFVNSGGWFMDDSLDVRCIQ